MRYPRSLAALVLSLVVVVPACGRDRSGGPQGDPTTIVNDAPARTLATGRAKVAVATPTAVSDGTVDFSTGKAEMRVRPGSATEPGLRNPMLAFEVVTNVVGVEPYGGAEVRGASTIRYELDVMRDGAVSYADVFIDSDRRIRRVSYPIDPAERRPSRTNRILAKLVTIDFYDFGGDPKSQK